MKKFKADDAKVSSYIHALVGGGPSQGKTVFASTWPKPLFLSSSVEGGYLTVKAMAKNPRMHQWWWDPNFVPEIWSFESSLDFITAINDLRAMATKGALPWQTLIVDSVSVFADQTMAEFKMRTPDKDMRQLYGDLKDYLYARILAVNALPMHVVWLCHVTDDGGLQLAGKTAASLPAYMDYKWRMHVEMAPNRVPDFQLRTKPFRGSAWIGGRMGQNIPDPMIPSFKCIAQVLNLGLTPPSPACPDFGGQEYPEGALYESCV